MLATADRRPEFTPPPEPGLLRAVSLAVAAHALLVLALSWGITWKRNDDSAVVEAEIWSPTPQQAAPKPVEPPPPPPPAPPVVQPRPAPPLQRDADIALEKERERKAAEDKRRQEAEDKRRQEAEQRRKQEAEQRRQEEADKREQARKAAEDKRRAEQAKARERKQQEEAALEKMRKENLDRIAGLAGATGKSDSTGTAMRSSGPSATYAGRLAALFKRNVVYAGGVETISGNPEAEIQVRVSPTGDILSAKVVRSSGNPSWDQAALRAIERSERIPPDVDGRYVQDFRVGMRPKN